MRHALYGVRGHLHILNFIETPLINHYYITVLHPTGQNVFQGFGDRASITTIK